MEVGKIEKHSYDVVVVGGGVAGVCAALAAARLGAHTALVQDRPVLGGNSSSEVRVGPKGAGRQNPWADETGILDELQVQDRKTNHTFSGSLWDLVLYDAVQREPDLELFLNTTVHSAQMAAPDRIAAAVGLQLASERHIAFHGRYFVDASGDGMFAASAGAAFRHGREGRSEFDESLAPEQPDAYTLPGTISLISRDIGRPVRFDPPPWIEEFPTEESLIYRDHSHFEHGFWWIELGGKRYDTITDNEQIRHQLIRHVLGVWDHIKNRGDHGAQNHVLEWFGWLPGKRESRRFEGDHILTENDLRQARLFPDRVAYGGWFLDMHAIGGIFERNTPPEPRVGDADWMEKLALRRYSIPLRSLYSRNIRNLFFAGRNVSVTHVAHGSIRVIGTGAVIGQAVGTAAHLCLALNVDPRELYPAHIEALQQRLLRDDCYIPALVNTDGADLARSATARASSEATLAFPDTDQSIELAWPCAQLFPLSSDQLSAVDLHLTSKLDHAASLQIALRPAASVLDFNHASVLAQSEAVVPAGTTSWVRFPLGTRVEPHRLYWIEVSACPGAFWHYSNDKHTIPVGTTAAMRRPQSTYWRTYANGDTTGCFSLRLEPEQRPYDAANVLTGVTRPESWTNIWVSDPGQPFKQSLELQWAHPVSFNSVQITFDTNVTMIASKTPPLTLYPECVRDYDLQYRIGEEWRTLLTVAGNYQRRRVHRFSAVESDGLRVVVHATNGDRSARVYEVRVYDERDQ